MPLTPAYDHSLSPPLSLASGSLSGGAGQARGALGWAWANLARGGLIGTAVRGFMALGRKARRRRAAAACVEDR